MAPNVSEFSYDKLLNDPPRGVMLDSRLVMKNFYNNLDGFLYKIYEYRINGSEYSGCFEVVLLHYKDHDNFPEEHAEMIYGESKNIEHAALEAMSLEIDPIEEIVIARYVVKNINISFDGASVTVERSGKQIKGAYVNPDYARSKITQVVYESIVQKYSILVSDNVQSIDGHSLWAYGVCKWGDVWVYDTNQQSFLCKLPPTGSLPTEATVPWSAVSPISAEGLGKLRQDCYTEGGCASHLVLVLAETNDGTQNECDSEKTPDNVNAV